jgi:RNA polymerase sigma-70 factor (ECF subfamily)
MDTCVPAVSWASLGVAKARDSAEAPDIQLAQKGDAAAFERLYRLHSGRVYGLCLRMVGNEAEAQELTQEAFLQVFRKIHTFRGDSAFSTWLHRLAVNVVLMRLRRKKPEETSLEAAIGQDDESERIPMEIGTRDLRLAGVADRISLQRAIAQLPPGYKQVLVLHDIHGYAHKEIAALLGCSAGNSKSQLHKSRMRVRKLMREEQCRRSDGLRSQARV